MERLHPSQHSATAVCNVAPVSECVCEQKHACFMFEASQLQLRFCNILNLLLDTVTIKVLGQDPNFQFNILTI